MTLLATIAIIALLSAPAYADLGYLILSWLITGGPMAPVIAAFLSLLISVKLTTASRRWFSCILAGPLTFFVYNATEEIVLKWSWRGDSILGLLYGPTGFWFCALRWLPAWAPARDI